jgi:mono/diheme cytochrome c family protein
MYLFRFGALLLVLAFSPAQAQNLSHGRAVARAHCGHCHAIGRSGSSPLMAAPPFRFLHRRYPVEGMQESLAEGIITGHPAMPEVRLAPDEIADFIAYLKTLER